MVSDILSDNLVSYHASRLSLDVLHNDSITQVLGMEQGRIHNTMSQLYLPDQKTTRALVANGILWRVTQIPNPPDKQQGSLTPAEGSRQEIKALQELGI